ncbi:MAG: nitrous oxide reductase accessory protein NosL [Candidatus Promineifilaceae bacterium]|nr:nitrous oxide reductase accessory protein NosL [Candidatus Promineifilaceae bacterium]
MKRHIPFLIFAFLLLLLIGCSQAANTDEPPKIVYGQDVCERCGMLISEENFAAAYWTKDGEARLFDDIGGMIAYNTESSEDVASYWVHDFETGEWLRAEDATYLLDSDLMTPMGFGIAAFAKEEQARALAYGQEDIMIMPFAALIAMNITMPDDLHELIHAEDGHTHTE